MYNQDCLEAMAGMEDNAYELAIVDPPYFKVHNDYYGNDFSSKGVKRSKFKSECFKVPEDVYFYELKRVSKNQIIWGANHYTFSLPGGRVIWDKDKDLSSFSDAEIAYQSFNKMVRYFRYRWNGFIQEDMANKENRIHPEQKPIALYKWLLKNYTNEGDRILDTHGGSGSIAIACYDMGFDLDWYEIDPDYYNDAVQRFQNHKAQGRLFQPKETYKPKQQKLGLN